MLSIALSITVLLRVQVRTTVSGFYSVGLISFVHSSQTMELMTEGISGMSYANPIILSNYDINGVRNLS